MYIIIIIIGVLIGVLKKFCGDFLELKSGFFLITSRDFRLKVHGKCYHFIFNHVFFLLSIVDCIRMYKNRHYVVDS